LDVLGGMAAAVFCGTIGLYNYGTDPSRKAIPPINKTFKLDFCTVAQWKNGRIVEENLFYDQIGMMAQLGLMA